MLTTLRAGVAVVMLLGFYASAPAIVAGLGWLTVGAVAWGHGVAGGKLGHVTVAVAGAILVALWRVIRAKPQAPSGVLSPERAPELWATVTDLAAALYEDVVAGLRSCLPQAGAKAESTRSK